MSRTTLSGVRQFCRIISGGTAAGLIACLSAAHASVPEDPIRPESPAKVLAEIRLTLSTPSGSQETREGATPNKKESVIAQWWGNNWSNWNNWNNWYKPWYNFGNYNWGNW